MKWSKFKNNFGWLFFPLASILISLTGMAQVSPLQTLRSHVSMHHARLGVSSIDAGNLSVTHSYVDPSTGISHIYAVQTVNGLTIAGTTFSLHYNGGKTAEANNLLATQDYNIKPVVTNISSVEAISRLYQETGYSGIPGLEIKEIATGVEKRTIYKRNNFSTYDIPVRLVYYNNQRLQTLQPAWEVQMMDERKTNFWLAYVDAVSGKILEKQDLILHCAFGGSPTDEIQEANHNHGHTLSLNQGTSNDNFVFNRVFDVNTVPNNKYRVYDMPLESPGDTIEQPAPHILGSKSGDDVASPDGWHKVGNATTYNYTRGNNVWSFQDPSPGPLGGIPSADPSRTAYANNGPLGAPPLTEPFIFDYPVNLANDPTNYQNGAIVNLFYWNNLIHDVFYNLGFTEAAGNFQDSHTFSTGTKAGGSAGDAVLAQAQDGGGTNNANFLTTPDGTPGQMQMYLWTASFPDSLVQIVLSSSGVPPAGKKYIAIQGSFNASPAANTNLFTNPVVSRQFVIVKKNAISIVGADDEGCSTGQQSIALPPSNDVNGKIVLIRRGSCSFAEKVLGAQEGGAAGVIIINNVDGPPLAMGGADAPGNAINIPAVMISKADGDVLIAQLTGGATLTGSLKRETPPAPKRDGDLDNGVIAHEYGHGISTRLTAPNTVGPLGGSEQGGEGWSDFIALYMTMRTNDLTPSVAGHPNGVLPTRSIGNYVTYQPANGRGIRPTPYSINKVINPSTFKDIGKGGEITIPHGVGYIWCTMLYEMFQSFIDQYGMGNDVYEGAAPIAGNPPASAKGNNIAMRLVLEGIKLQGTSPTFVRQRDAILKADSMLYNAQHSCMIWKAFAKRGLGASAMSNTNGVGDEFEAFDIPLTCDASQTRVSIDKSGPIKLTNGSAANYSIVVTNKYTVPLTGILVTDTLPTGLIYNSSSDGGVLAGNVVKWTIDLPANGSKTLTLQTTVNIASASTEIFSDNHEVSPAKWVAANNGGLTTFTYTNNASKAFSGNNYWFAANTGTPPGSNTTLRTANPIAISTNTDLVFIHKFSTEAKYDGGVLEVSADNINWTYVPPTKFVSGGYTNIITTTNNPAIGASNLAAFSGASPGYIVSIVKMEEYAGQNMYIRFRFTCDQTGGTVANEGWYIDDVYVLKNRTEINNVANAITKAGDPILEKEGSNASSNSSAFVLGTAPLASNLGNLNASMVRNIVTLNWNTLNEINADYFEVERKGANESVFTKIGTLAATGGSQQQKYVYSDASITQGARYHYRVKMVNRNGVPAFTNIALVDIGGKGFNVSLYPNPAGSIANLSIYNPTPGEVSIYLYDVVGKRIASFTGSEASSQVLSIPVKNLQAGTYWVEVNTPDNKKTLQLIVTK